MTSSLSATGRIIEIGDITAGIVVPETRRALRFHSAQTPFDRLDGQVFVSVEQATRTMRRLVEGRSRGGAGASPRSGR